MFSVGSTCTVEIVLMANHVQIETDELVHASISREMVKVSSYVAHV